jgi:predicted Zn-dependent protease
MPGSVLYRGLFLLGSAAFFLSAAVGLAYGLVTEHRLPPVEAEGNLLRSLEDHRAFAKIKPRNPVALMVLGDALIQAGERDEAVGVLERALRLRSAPPGVNQRLARLYYEQGRIEPARRQARLAYRRGAPIDPRLLKALGLAPARR